MKNSIFKIAYLRKDPIWYKQVSIANIVSIKHIRNEYTIHMANAPFVILRSNLGVFSVPLCQSDFADQSIKLYIHSHVIKLAGMHTCVIVN